MGLVDDLAAGVRGVVCRLPAGNVLGEDPNSVAMRAPEEFGVGIHVVHAPWRMDLASTTRNDFEVELQRALRFLFEQQHEKATRDSEGEAVPARTRDPAWSPLIELEIVELGAPAVWFCFRREYAPGREKLTGRFVLPVADGTVVMSFLADEGMTGYRESVLWLKRDEELNRGPTEHPGQAYFDDPAHDALFPIHSLARIRAARRWFESKEGGALRITRGAPVAGGEVVLEEADCAVCPPPRYVRLPAGTLPMAKSLATFSCVTLADGLPAMINVWKLGRRLRRRRYEAELTELALAYTKGWASEGARNIDVQHSIERSGPDNARAEVHLAIRFEVGESSVTEAQIWFVCADGEVYRIGSSAPPPTPPEELVAHVRLVRQSFRRLKPRGLFSIFR